MHNIYFTRHGETVWNVENKICGMTDSPLTARGQQQARQLGELVRDSGLHIDEILYSPLSRAADTAKAVAEATGLPARCEPRLREQCPGGALLFLRYDQRGIRRCGHQKLPAGGVQLRIRLSLPPTTIERNVHV